MHTPRTSFQTTDGLQSHRAKTGQKESEISPQNMNRAREQRKQRTVLKTKRARARPHGPTHAKRADDEERQPASQRGRKEVNSACKMLFHFSNIPLIAVSFLTIPAVIYYSIYKENRYTCRRARKRADDQERRRARQGRMPIPPVNLVFTFLPDVPFWPIPAVIVICYLDSQRKQTDVHARTHTHKKKHRLKRSWEGMLISARKNGFHFLQHSTHNGHLSTHSNRNCHLLFKFQREQETDVHKKSKLKAMIENTYSACKMLFPFLWHSIYNVTFQPIPPVIVICHPDSKENDK
jgi:hypothetical protein